MEIFVNEPRIVNAINWLHENDIKHKVVIGINERPSKTRVLIPLGDEGSLDYVFTFDDAETAALFKLKWFKQ